MSEYISEKIEQYERKLKQAEKAGKHNIGYGPNSGDDSGRVVVQPRALATRTRSL